MKSKTIAFFLSEGVLSRLVRLAGISGVLWAMVQFIDRFELITIQKGATGTIIFILASLCIYLFSELTLVLHNRPLPNAESEGRTPEQAFADSVLSYARTLAASTPPRDQNLLDLRNWTSRLLHLTGNQSRRQELGQLALTAAFALQDRQTQATILIDDLGWSVFESGDAKTARENINEGIALIEEQITVEQQPEPNLIELKCKALRHLANIQAQSLELAQARRLLDAPRKLAQELPSKAKELHLAQIDHSEAKMILLHIDDKIGTAGQIDTTGPIAQLLDDAVSLASSAETRFDAINDLERQAKAIHLLVQLLAHDARKQRYRAAVTRLQRTQAQVARNLSIGASTTSLQTYNEQSTDEKER